MLKLYITFSNINKLISFFCCFLHQFFDEYDRIKSFNCFSFFSSATFCHQQFVFIRSFDTSINNRSSLRLFKSTIIRRFRLFNISITALSTFFVSNFRFHSSIDFEDFIYRFFRFWYTSICSSFSKSFVSSFIIASFEYRDYRHK